MSDALMDHAINHAWANPQADRQHVIKLSRASRDIGDINYTTIMYSQVPLPTQNKRYHVFVIGQNNPLIWNFANKYNSYVPDETWIPISELWESRQLTADVYNDTGLMIPNPAVYLRMCYDHNILVCFEDFVNIPIEKTAQFYMRVYTNAWYKSVPTQYREGMMLNFGGMMSDANQVLSWQNRYLELRKQSGWACAFVNGVLVDDFPPGSYKNRDWVDIRYDGSVQRVVDIVVGTMPVFLSTLDKTQKVIFHPPRLNDASDLLMVCYDDVDFYVVGKTNKGLYFHKNTRSAVRTLTHRDYTLNVSYLTNYAQSQPGWGTLDELTIRAVIRQGVVLQEVPFEHARLREMYKLTDDLILSTFTDARSTLPEWQAANLELSGYTILLNTPYPYLTTKIVETGYGYNAMTQYMAATPMSVNDGANYMLRSTDSNGVIYPGVHLGDQLMKNSTCYDYDGSGLYLGYRYNEESSYYYSRYPNAVLIEGIWGEASKEISSVVGNDPVTLNKGYGYRCYRANQADGVVDETTWQDVTTDNTVVGINNGIATWLHNPVRYMGMVLFNNRQLTYEFQLDHSDRTLSFAITHTWPGGGLKLPFPLGKIDVVMNSRSLIPTIDYVINFPDIVIISKKHINQDGPNSFLVRSYGFCTDKLELQPNGDIGWIQDGQVSYNSIFDLRDDRNVRCIVGGQVVRREDLVYNEDTPQAVTLDPGYNGLPYYIDGVMSSMNGIEDYESYPMRDLSLDLDERLSSYLTSLWPQPDLENPTVITDKYAVYSPFFHKVMMDLKLGVLVVPTDWQSYEQLDTLLADYKWWLDYDPCVLGVNDQFMFIHPHSFTTAQSVTLTQYNFLQTITRVYLNDKVTLSGYLTISGA